MAGDCRRDIAGPGSMARGAVLRRIRPAGLSQRRRPTTPTQTGCWPDAARRMRATMRSATTRSLTSYARRSGGGGPEEAEEAGVARRGPKRPRAHFSRSCAAWAARGRGSERGDVEAVGEELLERCAAGCTGWSTCSTRSRRAPRRVRHLASSGRRRRPRRPNPRPLLGLRVVEHLARGELGEERGAVALARDRLRVLEHAQERGPVEAAAAAWPGSGSCSRA